MNLPLFQVDAFASQAFAGNQAAVCLLSEERHEVWMQQVAAEMNLAETAFLLPQENGWNLRWFSPEVEVDLCGHATLASAHILYQTGRLSESETARFQTKSGLLTAALSEGKLTLDFPAERESACPVPSGLAEALGVKPLYMGRNRFDYLIEVQDEQTVRAIRPDFELLSKTECRGVIVTSKAQQSSADFVSRFFAPATGIPEDPVTGSAHCCLGPFWELRLHRSHLTGHQVSARGGVVEVEMTGDRVLLRGNAVTISRGELLV